MRPLNPFFRPFLDNRDIYREFSAFCPISRKFTSIVILRSMAYG